MVANQTRTDIYPMKTAVSRCSEYNDAFGVRVSLKKRRNAKMHPSTGSKRLPAGFDLSNPNHFLKDFIRDFQIDTFGSFLPEEDAE